MISSAAPGVRIAAFVAGLAVVFGVLFGIGAAVGPWDSGSASEHGAHTGQSDQSEEGVQR